MFTINKIKSDYNPKIELEFYNWILDDSFGEKVKISWRKGNDSLFIYITRNNAEMWHIVKISQLKEFIKEFEEITGQ